MTGFADKRETDERICLVIAGSMERAGRFALFQVGFGAAAADPLLPDIFIGLGCFLSFIDPAFQHVQVSEDQFKVDGLNISGGADFAVHMDNLSAFETANHMNDSVYFPDMREKFVPEPFSFGSAFDQSGDIYKLDNGRRYLSGSYILASTSSRRSGTATTPMFGSMVQNG